MNINDVGPLTTLNSYLRNTLHLTATKYMCFEGGCGTCLVVIEEKVNDKKNIFAVNSVSIISEVLIYFVQVMVMYVYCFRNLYCIEEWVAKKMMSL